MAFFEIIGADDFQKKEWPNTNAGLAKSMESQHPKGSLGMTWKNNEILNRFLQGIFEIIGASDFQKM